MKVEEYAKEILFGTNLNSKLLKVDKISFQDSCFVSSELPKKPGRSKKIDFNSKQNRFPKGNFHIDEKKAMALHSFANHELLAIEMMAAALLVYPHNNDEMIRFKKGIIASLKDEQLHFQLYVNRLNEIGYDYGDFGINDFFWSKMKMLKTPEQYLATMSLTFEAANLDFADYYKNIFDELDDVKTSNVLTRVIKDEVSHVNLGVFYLNRWKQDKSLWDFYNESLPWPLTPARGKGKLFVQHLREKARMDSDFITRMRNYQDDYVITARKEWKK